jgi:hypothetical protein
VNYCHWLLAILYKGLEHAWILVSVMEVLEPIPHGHQGTSTQIREVDFLPVSEPSFGLELQSPMPGFVGS